MTLTDSLSVTKTCYAKTRKCELCKRLYPHIRSTSRFCSTACRVRSARQPKSKAHVSNNSGQNEWYTPQIYIEAARSVMGSIDLDPASSPVANEVVKATTFFTVDDDGLTKEWSGNVWLNPPYSQPLIGMFIAKLVQHLGIGDIKQAVLLVNNATETKWFQAAAEHSTAICTPRSRIRFLDPHGNPGAPLQGQSVLYFGSSPAAFISEFAQFGVTR